MKLKDLSSQVWGRAKDWYRARMTRKVFLFAIALFIIFLIITRFDKSGITNYIAMAMVIIALGALVADTWQSRQEFKKGIKAVEYAHKVRQIEMDGEGDIPPCFSPEDIKTIKRKLRYYVGIILLLVVGIVIIAILLFNGA